MQRNMSAPSMDPFGNSMQSVLKQQNNVSEILNYDFIDPSEEYISIRDKENAYQQYPVSPNTNFYPNFGEGEQSFNHYNTKTSLYGVNDQSIKHRSSTPHYLEHKSNTGIRSHNYSPLSQHRSSLGKSPSNKILADVGNNLYESSGKKKLNLASSSVKVMKKVFDEDYSLNSPSRKALQEQTDEEQDHSQYQDERSKEMTQTNRKKIPEISFDVLDKSYQLFLDKLKMNPKMEDATIDDYIAESIENFNHSNQYMRIGAAINLFDILYYNSSAILPEHVIQISTQIFNIILHFHASEDFYSLYLAFEVIRKSFFPL